MKIFPYKGRRTHCTSGKGVHRIFSRGEGAFIVKILLLEYLYDLKYHEIGSKYGSKS